MLQHLREKFTGTFALVILGMIGVSFVFFGLNYSFIGSNFAAKVDGEEINAVAFENYYRNELQRNPSLASLSGEQRTQVRRNLLEQLITRQLIDNYLDDNGYRISDEQVMQSVQGIAEFQVDGQFDLETYRQVLLSAGLDPVQFERDQRDRLRQQQLQLSVAATALVTPAEYRRYLNLFAEQRVVTVASIAQEAVSEEIEIDDETIAAFYEDNPTLYRTLESADIEYIELRRDWVGEQIEVSEEDIQAHYQQNLDRYPQDEQRQARHILVLFDDDEDVAEATANELLAKIQSGASFEALAAEVSADTLTAPQGGDFGPRPRSQYEPELASEIFSMAEGELAGPIKSQFGFHIVRLDRILEPGPLPLDQVRGELLSELRVDRSEALYRDYEKRLSDALFDLDDLQAIADAAGLEVSSVEGFTRSGGDPFGSNQAAIDAVFDELVLTGGQISEITELDAGTSAVFRVATYNEARRKPLDTVRDEVDAALRSQQADVLMVERADQMLAAIDGGEDFGIAATAAGLSVAEPQLISRTDQGVDQSLLFEVFAAGKPSAESPIVGRVRNLSGGYSVYSLDAVLPGRPESIPLAERDQGKLMLAQQSGVGDLQAFVIALRDSADVIVNEDLLAQEDLFQ